MYFTEFLIAMQQLKQRNTNSLLATICSITSKGYLILGLNPFLDSSIFQVICPRCHLKMNDNSIWHHEINCKKSQQKFEIQNQEIFSSNQEISKTEVIFDLWKFCFILMFDLDKTFLNIVFI
jgi:hypothetical protein